MNDLLMGYFGLSPEMLDALSKGKIIPNAGMKAANKEGKLWCPKCEKGMLVYDGHEKDGGASYYCNNCFKYHIDYSSS